MGFLASRTARIKPSASSGAAQRARELRAAGRDIVNLAQGEPDFPTPEHIIEAATKAMRAGETRYTDTDGTPQLKEALPRSSSARMASTYNLEKSVSAPAASRSSSTP